jgi:prophage regulatory protein
MRLLRISATLERTGDTRTPLYDRISKGLFTRPVKCSGRRAAGWPEHEVQAIMTARVAGASDDEVRKLVERLHEERQRAYLKTFERHMGQATARAPVPESKLVNSLTDASLLEVSAEAGPLATLR